MSYSHFATLKFCSLLLPSKQNITYCKKLSMDLKEKVVIITGGASGIGLSIVKKFLATEIKVIALFELETPGSIEIFSKLQREYGEKIDFYPCDVSNTSQLKGNFDKVLEKYKAISILVNNAGISSENVPERMIDINYKAVVLGSLMMIERVGKHKGGEGGTIVNVASVLGLTNFVMPIYCSTKHAVVSFTRTMKEQFEKTGVRVVAICPGATDTRIFDDVSKKLDFIDTELFTEALSTMQSPDNVATALMQVLGEGQSGDVWVVEDDQPAYLVQAVEDYKSMRIN